jgi:acyl-CoA thioesterase-1
MNPVTLHLASGGSLFSGGILLLCAVALSAWAGTRWVRATRNIAACVALGLILGSGVPQPPWLVLAFAAGWTTWLLAEESVRVRARTGLLRPRIAIAILTLLLAAVEIPSLRPPRIPAGRPDRLYVIGDSLSTGAGDTARAWPALLEAAAGIPVTNLAGDGATVADGLSQAHRVTESNAVVLIAIGGNDLLSGRPAREFEVGLDALLAALRRRGRTLVMLELPSLPFSGGYGRVQRTLAASHDALLVPRRVLTRVLGAPGATTDGLHLSAEGARQLADTLRVILGPAFASKPSLPGAP